MRIGVIGKGNVGTHLYKALSGKGIHEVSLVDSRNLEGIEEKFDLLILSVKDDAIREVASQLGNILPDFKGIVVHTSGSVEMETIKPFFKNIGVFYPLQTFKKDRELVYSEIPVFIEANGNETEKKLRELAEVFTDKIYQADSNRRKALHIGAVLSCNFVNFLFGEAEDILKENGYDFSVLYPLIRETLERTKEHSPKETQTGPAARGDFNVLNSHLELLDEKPNLHKIYRILSNSIYLKTTGKVVGNEQDRL